MWPGAMCKEGLTCFRISQYYWGCDVKQPATGERPSNFWSYNASLVSAHLVIAFLFGSTPVAFAACVWRHSSMPETTMLTRLVSESW